MEINISREMAQAVIAALAEHCNTNGQVTYGKPDDYTVTNEDALEFFMDVLTIEHRGSKRKSKNI